eukprot:1355882-Pyramimonas_sp.AAC.1
MGMALHEAIPSLPTFLKKSPSCRSPSICTSCFSGATAPLALLHEKRTHFPPWRRPLARDTLREEAAAPPNARR